MLSQLQRPIEYVREINGAVCEDSDLDVKLSPYIVVQEFPYDSRYVALLIGRSESVVLVERSLWQRLEKGEGLDLLSKDDFERLKNLGLFIPADINETELHRLQMQKRELFDNQLLLEIAVTQACNYRCVYCYEQGSEFPATYITSPVIEKIEQGIKTLLNDPAREFSDIRVVFIGGEALLRPQIVYQIMDRLIALAEAHNLPISGLLITNGHNLTRKVALELVKREIKTVQVTLDGPEAMHDCRRPQANKQGSYRRIIDNLNQTFDLLEIELRSNLDKQNYSLIPQFLEELSQEPFWQGEVNLIFAPVHATLDKNHFNAQYVFSEKDLPELYFWINKVIFEKGLGKAGFASVPTGSFKCSFFSDHTFFVEANGDLIRCPLVSGRPGFATGKIEDLIAGNTHYNTLVPTIHPAPYSWTNFNFAQQCLEAECTYYSMCNGGCPYESLLEQDTTHVRQCPKNLFETVVKDWVLMRAVSSFAQGPEIESIVNTMLAHRSVPEFPLTEK